MAKTDLTMGYSNNYLVKAIDYYPFNLEEAIESLNLAYSYDPTNTSVLCLLGRFHAEILKDYETAKEYYADALAENIHAIEIYPHYMNVLLWNEDYEQVNKLIKFALKVKGADKGVIYLNKAIMHEKLCEYEKALKAIKMSKKHTYNSNFMTKLNTEKDRIKKKNKKN